MPTIRLVPSEWYATNANVSVSDATNMYNNTDNNTSYATLTHSTVSTGALNVFLRGFNFDDVPSNAIVTDFTIKIKGYEYRNSTSTSYAPRLADTGGDGNSPISGTTASTNFDTSASIITIPTGSLTWSDLVNYGSNGLGIRISLKRTNKNNQCYVYIYGAEIDVTYTEPSAETLYFKQNGAWVTVSKAYKKVNGSWVEQADLTQVFDPNINYVKG